MLELEKRLNSASFTICFRGYATDEVDVFLDALQQRVRELEAALLKPQQQLSAFQCMEKALAQVTAERDALAEQHKAYEAKMELMEQAIRKLYAQREGTR